MICPRCKEKNSKDSKVCVNCGLKIKTICPRCKEPNKIGQPKCIKCNLTLIRFCPECKTPNFPHVTNCRKCGIEIFKKQVKKKEAEIKTIKSETSAVKEHPPQKTIQKTEKEINSLEPDQKEPIKQEVTVKQENPDDYQAKEPISAEKTSQEECKENNKDFSQDEFRKELRRTEAGGLLQELICKSDKGYLIGLSAPDGTGKTTVISSLNQNIKDQNIIWLVGQCEPEKKNVPYSFFRDLICTLFGISILNTEKEEIKKIFKKTLETNLQITDIKTIDNVLRLIINEHVNFSDNIEKNRKSIQHSIQTIFFMLNKKSDLVFVIEDFEYMDKASFECIKFLLKKGFLDNKNFLIINHNNSIDLAKFFPEQILSKQFLSILLKPLNNEELNAVMLSMLNNNDILSDNLKYKIFRQSKGLPIYAEQVLWYLFQIGAIYAEEQDLKFNYKYSDIDTLPEFSYLFNERLDLIEENSPQAKKIIYTAALFGFKFVPKLVQAVTEIDDQKMQETLQLLINNGIFSVYDENTLTFKHLILWKIIFERITHSEKIEEISLKILMSLKNKTEVSSAFLSELAEYINDNEIKISNYKNAAREAFSLGDNISYTDKQIKVYELLNESQISNEQKETEQLTISEQIGKANYELNPSVAIKYLEKSIEKYTYQENTVKLIELIGYLSRSCELKGDFSGVLDCAEKATLLIDEDQSSPKMMFINFSKLDAIFNMGRLEEAIVMAQNETLPFLNKLITKKETISGLSIDDIKTIEYETELILAKALIFQGKAAAFEILNKIASKAEKEKRLDYEKQALLGQALFSLIQGNINSYENTIEKLMTKGFSENQTDEMKLQWLFINIISETINGNYGNARNLCYSALPVAKENRDYNLFALIKLLSGFFYQHFQYYKNAMTIYNEIANYCSENKMATGALYAWYFAAAAELETGNPERAKEITEKALDVAQKPNINNYIAIILLSKLLAEIKIIEGDLEGAQINIESVLELAEANNLQPLLTELYLAFGKVYQENASLNETNKDYMCNCAYRTYLKALNLAEKMENEFYIKKVEKVTHNLNTFCKLSGITIEEK